MKSRKNTKTNRAHTRRPKLPDRIEIPLSNCSDNFLLEAIPDPVGGPFLWFGRRPPVNIVDVKEYVLFTTHDDGLYEAAKAIVAAYEWHASKYGGGR